MSPFKVIIVGGGLGGSLLANGLMNNGVDFTLYERDAAGAKREGYQIRLGDAAMEGFESCLRRDRILAIQNKLGQSTNQSSTAPLVCDSRFRVVLDLARLPTYSKSAAINRVVLRDLLLGPVEEAGRVRFGAAFSRYEIVLQADGRERVSVHFADGSTDTCDVLVAADGSGSKINRQVGARNIVDIDSHWGFVRKGSLPPDRVSMLPPRLLQGPMLVLSEGVSLYYARKKLDYDADEASFFWGLNVSKKMYPGHEVTEGGDHLRFCLEAIKHWAPEYHAMLSIGECDDDCPVMQVKIRASRPLSRNWRRKPRSRASDEGHPRVWLMGDAIHAMQTNRGMGGNQALRDCADLLPQLLRLSEAAGTSGKSPSSADVERALAAYESKMIDRAFAWVQKSGGTSVPNINLDGHLGTAVSLVGLVLLPIWRLLHFVRGRVWRRA
ncbi:FAD/NAD(P)-binding domain-containing protein [Colletotrichum zoysiae]|uniref:FAD/NAD(P)-binding domain-containing protein n=1 Tax=Colletotrichum zoysiae TaxID=1216348 RepID=A0AAD9H7U6_9PEZI|nr:FAD/NAD(P)-binding domain-containing protein [Colletotrichum zoysiae]